MIKIFLKYTNSEITARAIFKGLERIYGGQKIKVHKVVIVIKISITHEGIHKKNTIMLQRSLWSRGQLYCVFGDCKMAIYANIYCKQLKFCFSEMKLTRFYFCFESLPSQVADHINKLATLEELSFSRKIKKRFYRCDLT